MIRISPAFASRHAFGPAFLQFLMLLFLAAVPVLTAQNATAAETTVRSFSLDNRAAADLAGQIHDLYPEDELNITSQGQTLIVRASPDILDEIGTLIKTIDVAPAQMRISVRSGNQVNGNSQGGGITIHQGGVSVGAENKTITTARHREHSLIVQDGLSAHIKSGQIRAMPVAIQGGQNPAAILQRVDISSGFVIQPRVISDQLVELRVVAMDNVPQDNLPDGYKAEAVMTTRRVETGTWVELGSSETKQSGSQSGIVHKVESKRDTAQRFEIKVDVL